jgi:hypothetical protein
MQPVCVFERREIATSRKGKRHPKTGISFLCNNAIFSQTIPILEHWFSSITSLKTDAPAIVFSLLKR